MSHFLAIITFIIYEWYFILLGNTGSGFWDLTCYYAFDLSLFYSLTYKFFPRLSRTTLHKILKVMLVLLTVAVVSILNVGITKFLYWVHAVTFDSAHFIPIYKQAFSRAIYITMLASGYWMVRNFYEKKIDIYKVIQQKDKLEIALLRSQVNPHLIFNSLESVRQFFTVRYPETSNVLETLTDIIRISVKGSDPEVQSTLKDELYLISKLVDLNSETGKPADININVSDALQEYVFPTKMLANLVENVFKHGYFTDKDATAQIRIEQIGQQLIFNTINRIHTEAGSYSNSIGMSNTAHRLDRYFAGRHTLKIDKDLLYYKLYLTINF